jgi:hypothetical protein
MFEITFTIFNLQYVSITFKPDLVLYRALLTVYRVSLKSLPEYKHLLQENYMEYKYFFNM